MSSLSPVQLEHHPVARSQAVATENLLPGSLILSIPSLSYVLLPAEKGRRCDACHRLSKAQLRKCTGCASYFYCDSECQAMQWKLHHKHICKRLNRFTSSPDYQSLPVHEKLDALLLSHLVSQINGISSGQSSDLSTFLSLIPGPSEMSVPPICFTPSSISNDMLSKLYARFGNNNFAIHSHLNTLGHGIFPLASRYFNHSCVPNAAARYIFRPAQPVRMEVIALREISQGEEASRLLVFNPTTLSNMPRMSDLFTLSRSSTPPFSPSNTSNFVRFHLSMFFLHFSRENGPYYGAAGRAQ